MAGTCPQIPEEHLKKVTFRDAWGETEVWMLPFVKPGYVRKLMEESKKETDKEDGAGERRDCDRETEKKMETGREEIRRDYNEAVKFLLDREQVDREKRNVLISHQFYTAGGETPKTSDSETISVGGLDQVDISCLAPFSYVALGHIHRPQSMGRESIRYCGSMLKYSVSEWEQEKSVTEVILEAPGQEPVIQLHPLHPLREICVIRGKLEEILEANKDRICEDYVSIVLTDEQELYQPKEQLERIFTHILEVRTERNWKLAKEWEDEQEEDTQTDPKLVFEQFFSQIQGRKLQEEEAAVLEEVFAKIREEEE